MPTPPATLWSCEKTLDAIVESIICVDLDGLITSWNTGAERLYEYTAAEAIGQHYSFIYPSADGEELQAVQSARERVVADGRVEFEGWRVAKSGRRIFVRMTAVPIRDDAGTHLGFVGFTIDFTDRKLAEQHLAESEARLREELAFSAGLIEAQGDAGVGLMIVDRGRVIFTNPAGCTIVGYTTDEILALPSFLELIAPHDRERIADNHRRRLQGEAFGNRYDMQIRRKDGTTRDVELAVARLDAGDHFSILGVIVDITERKAAEARIQFMALHDPLTGLANRSLCFDRLNAAVALARRNATSFAVLYLDLDNFKPINDTWGHDAGDAVLRAAADRISACLRESDTVARTGGDEFIVIVSDARLPDAAITVGNKIIAALAAPLPIEGCQERLGASLGVAVFPMHGEDVDSLIQHADLAMYNAKRLGRSRCVVYGETIAGGGT